MGVPDKRESVLTLPSGCVSGKIGVVTITFGSGEVLPDFLKSLDLQTYRNFVLIAIDNASKDSTVEQLHAYQGCEHVVIANRENLGVAAGNNQGIQAAISTGCEYVLLLNNDVVFGPELFQQLTEGLFEHNCQMVTPIIYYHDRPDIIWAAGGYYQPWYGYRCLHIGDGEQDHGQYSAPRRVEHTPTCCVLAKREVFATVGLMDERYFVYHDDTDFMLRALKAGQTLYCLPQSKLLHKVSSLSGGGSDFQVRYGTRNRAFMLVKFLGRLLSIPYIVAYRVCYVLRFLSRKDDYRTFRMKLSSWTEGSKIPTNWWPV
ncbi:MAG TPA: glycosyltransferase family 2 protein [Edaphobacter sp.]|nr:glycosyltransferase family 2 protein [Edaphobacter sp.]